MRIDGRLLIPDPSGAMARRLLASFKVQFSQLNINTTIQRRDNVPKANKAATEAKRPELPPELWALILEYIIEPLYADYKYCDSYNYPIYQARHLWPSTIGDEEWVILLQECSNVRLVSREWAAITRSFRTVTFKDQKREEMRGMKKLVIKYNERDLNINIQRHVTSSLKELILFGHSTHYQPTDHSGAITDLLENPREFPQLRSLSIASSRVPPNFWTRLKKGFSQLISLTLLCPVNQSGSLSLPRLKILDIVWHPDIALNLPSLRHCSLLHLKRMASIAPFLRAHGERLESLLFSQPWTPLNYIPSDSRLDDSIWIMCPNLSTLGCPLPHFSYLDSPLDNHPLSHFRLGINRSTYKNNRDQLSALNKFKVKSILIEFGRLNEEEVAELKTFCDNNGVDLKWVPVQDFIGPKRGRTAM